MQQSVTVREISPRAFPHSRIYLIYVHTFIQCFVTGSKTNKHNDVGLDKGVEVSGKKQLFSRFNMRNHCAFVT